MRVEDQYFDVLQNIETAIVAAYDDRSDLLDAEVLDAIDALIRTYAWEKDGRGAPTLRLSDRAQLVFDSSRRMCEWRLGRQSLNPGTVEQEDAKPDELTVSDVVLCLQRIRSSVRLWTKQGGRQGYLDYVRRFLGQRDRSAEER